MPCCEVSLFSIKYSDFSDVICIDFIYIAFEELFVQFKVISPLSAPENSYSVAAFVKFTLVGKYFIPLTEILKVALIEFAPEVFTFILVILSAIFSVFNVIYDAGFLAEPICCPLSKELVLLPSKPKYPASVFNVQFMPCKLTVSFFVNFCSLKVYLYSCLEMIMESFRAINKSKSGLFDVILTFI